MIWHFTLEIINTCYQNCIHCSSSSCISDKTMLSLQMIENIVSQICKQPFDIKTLSISGGEPFLHPQFESIIALMDTNKICYNVYSCGIGRDKNPITKNDFELLKKYKCNKLIFSCHGINEKYNEIAQIDGFDIFKTSLVNAIEVGLDIELHFVPLTINIDRFEDVLRFATNNGIKKLSVLRPVPQGRCSNELIPHTDTMRQFVTYTIPMLEEKYDIQIRKGHPLQCFDCGDYKYDSCEAALHKMIVCANGDILPCEAFKHRIGFSDFNVYKNKLVDTLQSKLFLNLICENILKEEREWSDVM